MIRNGVVYFKKFSAFFSHPVIQRLAVREKWSVIIEEDDSAYLLDLKKYINTGIERKAEYNGPRSLGTLDALCHILPMADSYAYYMNNTYNSDGIVILNVEPSCPDDVKDEMLKMPYIYGEASASGGYHLMFPTPAEYNYYPAVEKKRLLRNDAGYEIWLQGNVPFTRNVIQPSVGTGDFVKLFCVMAEAIADKSSKSKTGEK